MKETLRARGSVINPPGLAIKKMIFFLALCGVMSAAVRAHHYVVSFQKVLESAAMALEEGDFSRLGKLEPYLLPRFEEYKQTYSKDLLADFRAAVNGRNGRSARYLLSLLAYQDIKRRFEFSSGASVEDRKTDIQIAYIDYYSVISKLVVEIDFYSDGYIRNCFKRAFHAPRAGWTEKILARLEQVLSSEKVQREK